MRAQFLQNGCRSITELGVLADDHVDGALCNVLRLIWLSHQPLSHTAPHQPYPLNFDKHAEGVWVVKIPSSFILNKPILNVRLDEKLE